MQKVPFMLVLGDKEVTEQTVAVRERQQGDVGTMTLAEFMQLARKFQQTRALSNQ